MDIEKYKSRKFIMSVGVVAATVMLAYSGKMDEHVALIFSALIASYNVMQGMIDKTDK
jgi:hypothetical protein